MRVLFSFGSGHVHDFRFGAAMLVGIFFENLIEGLPTARFKQSFLILAHKSLAPDSLDS